MEPHSFLKLDPYPHKFDADKTMVDSKYKSMPFSGETFLEISTQLMQWRARLSLPILQRQACNRKSSSG
jgi:hypothetical protein